MHTHTRTRTQTQTHPHFSLFVNERLSQRLGFKRAERRFPNGAGNKRFSEPRRTVIVVWRSFFAVCADVSGIEKEKQNETGHPLDS